MAEPSFLSVGRGCGLCEPAGMVNGEPFSVCTEMCTAEMRGLTVRQPWAHMIARCGKQIENRTWATHFRGLLAIHAGAHSGWDPAGEASPVARAAWREWSATLPPLNVTGPLRRGAIHIDFGAVIAVAELAGCHRDEETALRRPGMAPCSPWSVRGAWHWELRGVRTLAEPVPCRGALRLWNLPEDVEKAVRGQLVAAHG